MARSELQLTIQLSEAELDLLARQCQQTGQAPAELIRGWIQSQGETHRSQSGLTRHPVLNDPILSSQAAPPLPQQLSDELEEQTFSPQTEFNYQAFLNTIPDLVLRVQADGTCLECISPKAPQSGVFLPIVSHIREVLPSHLLQPFLQQLEQALLHRSVQVFEHPLEKYGQLYFEEVRMFPLSNNEGLILVRDITAQKRAQQERDRIFSLSLELICTANFDGYLQDLNPAWEKTLGHTREELMAVPYLEYVHPDDLNETVAQAQALTQGQNAILFQNRYRHKDGSYRWVSWNAIAIPSEGMIYAIGRDITSIKEATIALHQSEERYRSLVSNLPGVVYFCHNDPDWTMEFISEAIQDLAGYPASDFIHNQVRTYNSIIYQDDRDRVNSSVQAALDQGVPFEMEYRIQHLDGTLRWVYERGQGIFDTADHLCYLDGVIFDISARKQMDDALRLAEANYRSIFENALSGIFQSTPEGHYLRINQAMAQIHGYDSPEQMIAAVQQIGQQIYVDPVCRQEFQHLMELHGEVKGLQYQVRRRDGRKIWIEENTRAVRDADGNVLYHEGSLEDITARKAEEEALRVQLQSLRIEIDQKLRHEEVNKILQTDYFQALEAEIELMRKDSEIN